MSLLSKLCETYDNCSEFVGEDTIKDKDTDKKVEKRRPLFPCNHSTRNAHLEITIDYNGNFKRASTVDKNDAITITAVTEESDNRVGNPAPHGLNDELRYIAGDLINYFKQSDKLEKDFSLKNTAYLEQLQKWCESPFPHPKAEAIYKYLIKKRVIKDLIDCKLILTDENGYLIPNEKQNPTELYKVTPSEVYKAFCRFRVESQHWIEDRTYKDKTLFESWSNYCRSLEGKTGICYASGKETILAEKHPKYIRTSGDGAKLISGNDDINFTFRGIFTASSQACAIGSEISQKAHAALKWLIDRQGYRKYDHAIVVWSTGSIDAMNPVEDYYDSDTITVDIGSDTSEAYASKISKMIDGYRQKLKPDENINIAAFDAATTGRLSVIYYREFNTMDYLDRLQSWYDSCCWVRKIFLKDKTVRYIVFTPSPVEITRAAYGQNPDDKIYHSTIERLLPCIIDGQQIPYDLVKKAVIKASNPQSFDYTTTWENVLETACALYKKYNEKERYKMALDFERTSRDYLFGRLLAVADELESWALWENGDKRPTTASRYFSRFSAQPYQTWKIIEENLRIYVDRLGAKANGMLKVIDEIMSKFKTEDFISPKALCGEYLLGYHNQKYYFTQNLKEKESKQ